MTIKFKLDGCDISFVAEAPEDITLAQLLKQADKIIPDWCACGIRSLHGTEKNRETEIRFDYDRVYKVIEDAPCVIAERVNVE